MLEAEEACHGLGSPRWRRERGEETLHWDSLLFMPSSRKAGISISSLLCGHCLEAAASVLITAASKMPNPRTS